MEFVIDAVCGVRYVKRNLTMTKQVASELIKTHWQPIINQSTNYRVIADFKYFQFFIPIKC